MTTVLWSLLFVVLALVVLALVAFIAPYNALIRQRSVIEESWRQLDEELSRRHELVGAVLEVVQDRPALATRAQSVAQCLDRARGLAAGSTSEIADPERSQAEQALTPAVHQLLSAAEQDPGLSGTDRLRVLRRQLADSEDRIAAGRRFYNANARAYNNRVAAKPGSVVARLFNFGRATFFDGSLQAQR